VSVKSEFRPLQVRAGVQPSNDSTALASEYYTFADKIRFDNGFPRKLGGWKSILYKYKYLPTGIVRRIFSLLIQSKPYALYGSNTRLYAMAAGSLTNITPLDTTSIAAPNSLATQYGLLAANPITTANGSNIIIIADPDSSRYQAGDRIVISGATSVGGVPASDINANFLIVSSTAANFTVRVATTATASATGGGAAVNRASGLVRLTKTAHGLTNDTRISVLQAAATGGITAAQLNREHTIRNVAANTFDLMTEGTATSAVTAGGGSNTIYYVEIVAGAVNESAQTGYGAGLYGVGLYGVPLSSASARNFPRIWFMDRFGETVTMTPGNQGKLYTWTGDPAVAPVEITGTGHPTAINYQFVSNNIVVTFGQDYEDFIFSSDQGDFTEWTSSSTNQVFRYRVLGAGRLIAHAPTKNFNLIYSDTRTYQMRYIGLPSVWEIKEVDANIGIISPLAAVVVEGIPYWMDDSNFYMYNGSTVDVIPSATLAEATCLQYVFDNLNYSQKSKVFGWYNKKYNEIWWHYPTATGEPDSVVRLCLNDMSWTTDTFDRTAAEFPNQIMPYPQLASSANDLYYHENGVDADNQPMPFKLVTNLMTGSKNITNIQGFIPDSIQNMPVTVTVDCQLYPQSSAKTISQSYSVEETTEYTQITASGRYWRYTIEGNALGQDWQAGQWQEDVQIAGNK
jgi:hypothetical protein